ncbi:VanZ family protein [Stutzerimonas nitrititolerans]|uniref:VanZ family protein n=1 Tax=Stutzerimonas nitrititolerans TaxID=2482751 RepID=UPI0035E3DFC2
MAPFWLALMVLLVMALKSSPNNQFYQGADKLYHWIGFATLTFTAHLAFPRVKLSLLFICILIGATSIELLQALSPSRTASLGDMTVNIVGVLTGLGATQLIQKPLRPAPPDRRRSRRKKRRSPSMRHEDLDGGSR